ncbi:MAG: GNAT family N-acetyltransferase, partial [Chloroflexi bacterium]|nr:GNAT family N-acetyltransferase [Chloroflexota bacterium]
MNPPERIETERLVLRKPRMEDAPVIFETYAQDPEVTRYLVWKPHKNLQETEQFLLACGELWRTGKDFAYAITLKDMETLIGMFGLHPMNLKLEVGYALARPYWGKGYMTEALRAVIDWAFAQPEIYRVQAICDVENIGSARVMEKADMAREGLLRRYVLHPNISAEP